MIEKLISWVKFPVYVFKGFKVDGALALLGVVGFIAWLFGYEPGFFGLLLTMYAMYTSYRLRDAINKIKELSNKK